MAKEARPSVMERLRGVWRRLMNLEDTPHRIAFGVAIGTWVAFQPIVGVQMVVGALVSRLLGANVVASLPMAWITNPFTIVPVYYSTYRVGIIFTGGEKTYDDIKRIFEQVADLGFWRGLVEGYYFLVDIFWPMVVGGALVGVLLGAMFYVPVRHFVRVSQERETPPAER
jgi:uncharacterized protein